MRFLSFIGIVFLLGCSSTKQFNTNLTPSQSKISISKKGEFLFYAFLKNGKKVVKISKKRLNLEENEEVIRVYKNGYYPIYDIFTKGKSCISRNKKKSNLFCNSIYTQLENPTRDILLNILGSVVGLTLADGFQYNKVFSIDNFKKSILESKLLLIKQTIQNDNFTTLKISTLKINPKKNQNKIIINSIIEADIIVIYDAQNNFKNIINISNLKQKNLFEATFILTQRLVDVYFKPKEQIDIGTQIPPKIQKPILPKVPKLLKSEFETKAMFDSRVQKAMSKREAKIKKLQLDFRKRVESRNKRVEELQRLYQKDIDKIKSEQIEKQKNIAEYMPYFTSIAMRYLVGSLSLKNLRYDAEHQLMYADLESSNNNFFKKIYLKIPLDRAREFKLQDYYDPIVTYDYSKNSLTLKEIKVDKYYAKLSEIDYKPQQIEVRLQDKKINTNYAQNDLSLQNPNLKDKYSVVGVSYKEGVATTIANYQDDLPKLLQSIQSVAKDPKKWLFVIGAEKYDNTDNVIYSKRSAELFAKVAKKSLGIIDRNSYELIGDGATSGAIEDRLNRMLENVKEGDHIYFYYSGHGIPVLPNRIPYLLPKDKIPDYIGRNSFFKLTNIYTLLSNSKASKVIAIMDSCFSGSTDGKSVFKGVAGSVLVPKRVTFNHNKMVVLTAGREKQFSNMYAKKGHRLFSYFLMRSILEGKREIKEIYNDIFPKVKDTSNGFGDLKRQEPTIEGNEKLNL